jgi:hypothetical protein
MRWARSCGGWLIGLVCRCSRLGDGCSGATPAVLVAPWSSIVIGIPKTEQHRPRGRGRLVALGRRTDDGKRCSLLVVNEADGSWSFYGVGASAGVKLGKADTVALVELILARTESRDPNMSRRSDRVGGTR